MTSHGGVAIVRGRGAHVWDDRGQRFVDWVCGYGPIILGHGDVRVADAVHHQLLEGALLPGGSPIARSLSKRLIALFPGAEACVFLKTGSEAVVAAARFARLNTRRSRILRVGFHGWHDGLIDGKIGWHNWDNVRVSSLPVPGVLAYGFEISQARTAAEIEYRVRHPNGSPFAALLVDPIQLSCPEIDLPLLRAACSDMSTLLILDETKTAFRIALGGVQEICGIRADLTVAGKALANGLPLSSVIGASDLIRTKDARIKGTFSGERSALVAAHTTLDVLETEQVCEHLSAIGSALIEAINGALRGSSASELVTAVPYRWSSMPHLHADTDNAQAQECRRSIVAGVMARGALLLEKHNSFVCAAHTLEDIQSTAEAVRGAVDDWLN